MKKENGLKCMTQKEADEYLISIIKGQAKSTNEFEIKLEQNLREKTKEQFQVENNIKNFKQKIKQLELIHLGLDAQIEMLSETLVYSEDERRNKKIKKKRSKK